MRTYIPLLLLALTPYVSAEPLPRYLNSNETLQSLPAPNLPVDAYRPSTPALQLPKPGAAQPQPLLMSTRLTIRKLQVEGGTVYPLQTLGAAYQPLLGREITLSELIEATRKITQRYQADGYLLSYAFLPPQKFDQGLVRVVLVEGYIRDYHVDGDVGRVKGFIDELVDKLKGERPLTRKTFDRYATLMSRIPGVTLQAQVPPPGTTDGAATMHITASRKPFTTSMSLVESSRDSTQALLGVSSNSQTAMAEQLTLSGLFPPGHDKEHYYRLDYSQYLNAEGTQLSLYGTRYRSDPATRIATSDGFVLKPHRENDRFSIGISHPLIVAPDQWLSLAARLYGVNDKTDYEIVGYAPTISEKTNVRALAFEGDWRKSDAQQLRIVSAGVYQGINGLGAKTESNLTGNHYDLDFFRLRLSGVQSNTFFDNWQGVMSAAVYWSDDTLADSERAVFGGQNFGRGYPDDQASGDKGWGVAYELNYSFNREGEWVKLLQPYAVLDRAKTWFNELPLKGSDMSSAALGVRFGDKRYYNMSLEVAKPMSDMALDSFNRRLRYSLSFSYQL
ncbi:ShlB/FhaC/HecB family hemolysin secretion/activation protein [Pseudomonas sp. 7P_10.2_Bac1]|uniref:ShlB/FhaC/HecB family hemolysin secretion/activation protein n=1 Tax=Pseudomonas sp. 7P_10.2_Bac1 TaxID=2971614 RepID=UPI0021C8CA4D|nr:POTRA domain-containing protein [Pseudomonas sp. 7P_10.2_Bac1]MCU1728390.1 ShlB/FhaC/HecB family hemolysin secretion/activation protein [Pseudomonas sp. 7P_10.2_Bac1]